jgi:FMN phosphatase YigB (HAD superfamily)
VPVAVLTNGSADNAGRLLRASGLAGLADPELSVEAVRAWKPAPAPYRHAARELGVAPERLMLVAAHPWDCAGATAGRVAGRDPARGLGSAVLRRSSQRSGAFRGLVSMCWYGDSTGLATIVV